MLPRLLSSTNFSRSTELASKLQMRGDYSHQTECLSFHDLYLYSYSGNVSKNEINHLRILYILPGRGSDLGYTCSKRTKNYQEATSVYPLKITPHKTQPAPIKSSPIPPIILRLHDETHIITRTCGSFYSLAIGGRAILWDAFTDPAI